MPIDWFHPERFLWLALLIPIVVLYFLRFGGRRLEVSSSELWQLAIARRSWWSRLRQGVSAGAACLVLVALLLAAAHPFFAQRFEDRRYTVVVLDVSASMRATDVTPDRFTQARENAVAWVDSMGLYDEAAIVTTGGGQTVVCPRTSDRHRLKSALAQIVPCDGREELPGAMSLAKKLLHVKGQLRRSVLVFSDFAGGTGALKDGIAEHIEIQPFAVGDPAAANSGITQLALRPHVTGGDEVFVEAIRCSPTDRPMAPEPAAIQIGNGTPVEVLHESSHGSLSQRIFRVNATGDIVTAKLNDSDALSSDDQATAILPAKPVKCLRIDGSQENLPEWLTQAFSVLSEFAVVADPADDQRCIRVFWQDVPVELPPGPALVISPANETNMWKLSAQGAAADPPLDQLTHPSLIGLRSLLADMVVEAAIPLVPSPAATSVQVVASAASGRPVCTAIDRADAGRVLVVHPQMERSDFHLRPSVPHVLQHALHWITDAKLEISQPAVARDVLSIVPTQFDRRLATPGGQAETFPAGASRYGPPLVAGEWSLNDRVLPVALLDPQQSAITPGEIEFANISAGPDRTPLWLWAAVVAFGLLLIEAVLHARRVLS